MSKTTFVDDIRNYRDGQGVKDRFKIGTPDKCETTSGDPFLKITVSDKTGRIAGRMWDTASIMPEAGDVVRIVGEKSSYRDSPQLKINKISKVPPEDFETSNFEIGMRTENEETFEQLVEELKERMDNPVLKEAILGVLGEYKRSFSTVPAAESNHHAETGGLARHVLSMVRIASDVCERYDVRDDVVIAGCVLHDIGKVVTFDPMHGRRPIEDEIGHIVKGVEILNEQTDLNPALEHPLKHIIVSHHGENEWGSPCEPKSKEAKLVHLIDQMDSTMNE